MTIVSKYRIYPTAAQKHYFECQFGMCRLVYNWCLDLQIKEYQESQSKLHKYELQKRITQLKKDDEYSFLKTSNSQSLNAETEHLESAFKNFFRTRRGFPKFKCKHGNHHSFTIPQYTEIRDGKLHIPKVKDGIKIKLHRPIEGGIKTCVISRNPSGEYYISINQRVERELPAKVPISENQAVGLDVGIKTFATLSDGTTIENPKFLNTSLRRLKKLSRKHSKKLKGSKNRDKSRLKLAKLHQKVANQRSDFHHKVTKMLVDKYDTICLETLSVTDMHKTASKSLSRQLNDVAFGIFNTLLQYKADWCGKNILRCGRFEPSSKMCTCGTINNNLTLNDRIWTCSSCGTTHNRDLLAANNIKKFCFIKYNTSGTEEI